MLFSNLKNRYFEYIFTRILKKLIKNDFIPNDYQYFLNEKGIDKWGDNFNRYFRAKEEKIRNYSSSENDKYEIETYKHYSGYVSIMINAILRGDENINKLPIFKKRIESLTQSLKNFTIEKNIVAIRRLPKNTIIAKLKEGQVHNEKGFISTSLNLYSRLNTESEYKPISNEILMILKIRNGLEACYIEEISKRKEYELLIQRNQKIRIIKTKKVLNNRIVFGEIIKGECTTIAITNKG